VPEILDFVLIRGVEFRFSQFSVVEKKEEEEKRVEFGFSISLVVEKKEKETKQRCLWFSFSL